MGKECNNVIFNFLMVGMNENVIICFSKWVFKGFFSSGHWYLISSKISLVILSTQLCQKGMYNVMLESSSGCVDAEIVVKLDDQLVMHMNASVENKVIHEKQGHQMAKVYHLSENHPSSGMSVMVPKSMVLQSREQSSILVVISGVVGSFFVMSFS